MSAVRAAMEREYDREVFGHSVPSVGVNRLPTLDDDRWRLPRHAHVIIYETEDGGEFLTIYDCGAAQKPPSARLIGNLVHVDGEHEIERQPTGYVVKMREESVLEAQSEDHYVIRA